MKKTFKNISILSAASVLVGSVLFTGAHAAVPSGRPTPMPQNVDVYDMELDHDLDNTANNIDDQYLQPVATVGSDEFFEDNDIVAREAPPVRRTVQLDVETRVGGKVSHSTLIVPENEIGHFSQEGSDATFNMRIIPSVLGKSGDPKDKASLSLRLDVAKLIAGQEKLVSSATIVTLDGRTTKIHSQTSDHQPIEVTVIPSILAQ